MKITIDVRMLHSSGIGVYIQNLVPRIIRLRPKDHFCLLGKASDREDDVWKGLSDLQWVDCESPIYSLRQQLELLRKIPKDTDLLWIPHYDVPVFYRGRMMVTVHDLFHLAMPPFAGGILKRIYARWMFEWMARKAASVVVISRFTQSELLRLVKMDESKVHQVHNGVDESWFHIRSGERPHARPYFLYVGNIKPHKNLKKLLEAFSLLKDQIPHDLLLVGRKEGFISGDGEVQEWARQFPGRVEFVGEVPLEALRRYFVHAEALVFPSLYEGFGMPPLEAMACGCPVAVTNSASIPEVCGDGALYFDPNDPKEMAGKMLELAQDKALRDGLVQKGLARARLFSWEQCAIRTSTIMDEAAR